LNVLEVLEEPVTPEETSATKKAKIFYKSCMDVGKSSSAFLMTSIKSVSETAFLRTPRHLDNSDFPVPQTLLLFLGQIHDSSTFKDIFNRRSDIFYSI